MQRMYKTVTQWLPCSGFGPVDENLRVGHWAWSLPPVPFCRLTSLHLTAHRATFRPRRWTFHAQQVPPPRLSLYGPPVCVLECPHQPSSHGCIHRVDSNIVSVPFIAVIHHIRGQKATSIALVQSAEFGITSSLSDLTDFAVSAVTYYFLWTIPLFPNIHQNISHFLRSIRQTFPMPIRQCPLNSKAHPFIRWPIANLRRSYRRRTQTILPLHQVQDCRMAAHTTSRGSRDISIQFLFSQT